MPNNPVMNYWRNYTLENNNLVLAALIGSELIKWCDGLLKDWENRIQTKSNLNISFWMKLKLDFILFYWFKKILT